MPRLQSPSIRFRGNRSGKDSTSSTTGTTPAPLTTSQSIKHLFFGRDRVRKTASNSSTNNARRSTDRMGNAPSDMNSRNNNPRTRAVQLARSTTDAASVRSSRAMPGAEPATPASSPSPEPHRDHQHVPEPKTEGKVLEGHNVQAVSHIQNPSVEERDLGIGPIPADGSFVAGVPATKDGTPPEGDAAEYLAAQEQQAEDPAESEPEPKTPRGAAKSENSLTPAEGEDHKHAHASPPGLEHHTPEGSDATAVSTGSNSGSTPGGAWAPGTYVLLNARSGTAVDMSGMDNKTLIGYPMHGGPNQQWEFIPSGYGYVIRCVRRSAAGDPLYLTTEDGLRDDAAIVASPYPVTWDVEQTEDGIKISWPNTDFVFDLADWGSATPGTKIQLMHFKPDQPGQLWHYTRCAPAEHEKELEVRSARAVSPPATTETVSVTEERDHITTTRTTTTTTMTTITEVTRMPRWMLAHARSKSPNRRSIGYRVA